MWVVVIMAAQEQVTQYAYTALSAGLSYRRIQTKPNHSTSRIARFMLHVITHEFDLDDQVGQLQKLH
jgi:hypothetical protein